LGGPNNELPEVISNLEVTNQKLTLFFLAQVNKITKPNQLPFQVNMMYACITVLRALALQDGPKKVEKKHAKDEFLSKLIQLIKGIVQRILRGVNNNLK
jgi:hypothetical protein